MKYIKYLLISCYFFVSCKETKIYKPIVAASFAQKKVPLNEKESERWFEKDILIDSIPGISLNRAYDSLLKGRTGKSVVVAVIDTEIDINHEDLKGNIWTNTDEIPDNGIDDDQNGYIDDKHGWNFIGNSKGDNIIFSSLECVRVIQEYRQQIEEGILNERSPEYALYTKAKKYYESKLKSAQEDLDYGNFLFKGYPKAKVAMKKIFPKENYTTKELDSVYEKYKKTNRDLARNAYFMSDCIKYNLSEEWITNYQKRAKNKIDYTYNLDYVDKENIDPFPNEVTFNAYGTHFINKNINEFYHGTLVAGLIGASRNNATGINGVNSNIEIMTLAISSNGEENDKDIALAIKYAVDNGAKVINMSFGKEFSLHKQWVFDAFKYAEKKNVLIVSSAGNSAYNLKERNNYYPNDNLNNEVEVSDNFLLVGSISKSLDASLLSHYSNYGSTDVDVFAPGQEVYTIMPNNEYKFDSGTSISAAITSGVASLVYSYYPDLTASQVKHILMDSGLEFDIQVNLPTKEDEKNTVRFSELSKSGKVVNAYNALIMADSISRGK